MKRTRVSLETFQDRPTALTVTGPKHDVAGIRGLYQDPFKRNPRLGVMPLTPMSLRLVHEAQPKALVDPEVVRWYEREQFARDWLRTVTERGRLCEDPRLYPFQRQGVSFLIGTEQWWGPRALLADDPRLGKTIQAVVVADRQRGPVLVLTLKALVDFWASKVAEWSSLEPVVIRGSARERLTALKACSARVAAVTNWATLRIVEKLPAKHFSFVVCDEAHEVRNRKAQVTKAFMRLRPEGAVLASATMIEHGPEDYFPLLRVLRPWEFRSYWRWIGWYCKIQFNGFANTIVGSQNEALMKDHLTPLAIGREARAVADVPEKVYEILNIEPSQQLMDVYTTFEEEILIDLGDRLLPIPNQLARMVRLRQISSAPQLLGIDLESPKIDATVQYVQTLSSNIQVLVYTSFRETAKMLAQAFEAEGISAEVFIGGSDPPVQFLSGAAQVLVATPEVGGVGQDYSNADVIMYVDPVLSATTLRQSQERTTRIGMKKPRLIVSVACTPIDYATADALKAKQERIRDVDIYEFILRGVESRRSN